MDVPTFDGRLDSQHFLDWIQQLDKYFTWYNFTQLRKVKFAAMKLSDQASQYWTNLEIIRAACDKKPINTWYRMKDELRGKYVPPSFSAYLMDEWDQYT